MRIPRDRIPKPPKLWLVGEKKRRHESTHIPLKEKPEMFSPQIHGIAAEIERYSAFRVLRVKALLDLCHPDLPVAAGYWVPAAASAGELRLCFKPADGLLLFVAALRAGNDYRRVIRNFHGFASSGGGFDGCVEAPSYQPPEGAPA